MLDTNWTVLRRALPAIAAQHAAFKKIPATAVSKRQAPEWSGAEFPSSLFLRRHWLCTQPERPYSGPRMPDDGSDEDYLPEYDDHETSDKDCKRRKLRDSSAEANVDVVAPSASRGSRGSRSKRVSAAEIVALEGNRDWRMWQSRMRKMMQERGVEAGPLSLFEIMNKSMFAKCLAEQQVQLHSQRQALASTHKKPVGSVSIVFSLLMLSTSSSGRVISSTCLVLLVMVIVLLLMSDGGEDGRGADMMDACSFSNPKC